MIRADQLPCERPLGRDKQLVAPVGWAWFEIEPWLQEKIRSTCNRCLSLVEVCTWSNDVSKAMISKMVSWKFDPWFPVTALAVVAWGMSLAIYIMYPIWNESSRERPVCQHIHQKLSCCKFSGCWWNRPIDEDCNEEHSSQPYCCSCPAVMTPPGTSRIGLGGWQCLPRMEAGVLLLYHDEFSFAVENGFPFLGQCLCGYDGWSFPLFSHIVKITSFSVVGDRLADEGNTT